MSATSGGEFSTQASITMESSTSNPNIQKGSANVPCLTITEANLNITSC